MGVGLVSQVDCFHADASHNLNSNVVAKGRNLLEDHDRPVPLPPCLSESSDRGFQKDITYAYGDQLVPRDKYTLSSAFYNLLEQRISTAGNLGENKAN